MTKVLVGTRRVPAAVKRLWLWRGDVARTEPVGPMYDEFGQHLFAFANVLTDDAELAERLIIQSLLAYESEPSTLRELSAGVYIAWLAWDNPLISDDVAPLAEMHAGARLLREIRELPADQRAALGLCKYGGHSYRSAADVLGLAADRVARLLRDALHGLALPRIPLVGALPAA